MKIKLSKSQWEGIGKKAGWIKTADKISDCCSAPASGEMVDMGICPECKEHCEFIDDDEQEQNHPEEKKLSFTYGTTPENIILKQVRDQTPNGYSMHIKSNSEWRILAKAVNQGIDSHLQGFTRSTFDNKTGKVLIHPEEMPILLRRLMEDSSDEAMSLRTDILATLGIEEI